MIRIADGLTDDSDFLGLLGSLVGGLVARLNPEEVWIVHIDNWFDHKWLEFSGTGTVPSKLPRMPSAFRPTCLPRIKSRSTRRRLRSRRSPRIGFWGNGLMRELWMVMRKCLCPSLPHDSESKGSRFNIQRRIEDRSDSACFLWYSGNTLKNGRGSIMVYEIEGEQIRCWFASFRRHNKWELTLKLIHSEP